MDEKKTHFNYTAIEKCFFKRIFVGYVIGKRGYALEKFSPITKKWQNNTVL
jgi:hypothetical protein